MEDKDTTTPASEPPGGQETTTYIVEPTTKHTHTIILLHGLGSNGAKFGQELLATGRTSAGTSLAELLPGARFVFPTAKRRRSSAFGRTKLMQWFDIARLADPSYRKETQLEGLAESAGAIRALLCREAAQVAPGNIILGGISQGCATSLSVLLSLEYPLGGYVGMCGYLPFREDVEREIEEPGGDGWGGGGDGDDVFAASDEDDLFERPDDKNRPLQEPALRAFHFERDLLCLDALPDATLDQTAALTPIFLGHGDADEKKPYELGEAAARTMRAAGYSVEWKLYGGLGHWYKIPDEIDDIAKFICEDVGWESILVNFTSG
ncbi:acyl-protein thioesterase [Xylaria sp. FL1777]|nr:acyl-protein thioesterase [Xylaria sp. FL1777]